MTSTPDAEPVEAASADEVAEAPEVTAESSDAAAEPSDATPEADDATAETDTAEAEPAEEAVVERPEPDPQLIAAHDLALSALHEITPASTVGPAAGYTAEEGGAVSLRFENRLPGYPGWYWTVSLARVTDAEPTVLEVELLPGDGALLAPEWVPWATRLAEYHAQQAALAEAAADDLDDDEASDADDESDADEHEDDEDDDEFEEASILHSGDVDGVDIDELDESSDEDDDASDDSDEDDEDDDESDED
ncbi:DUF3027 domain-containing protein [Microbacterium sp. NPDC089189]|uniref:DUF3027 domain-containing protein n=1 Tax=Microbacterium sp. NPDC089189 TaxID=3154972 RepID=UPI0034432DCF